MTPENLATMEPDEREEYLREHPQEPEPTPAPTISDDIREWLAQAKQEHDAAEPYDHTCYFCDMHRAVEHLMGLMDVWRFEAGNREAEGYAEHPAVKLTREHAQQVYRTIDKARKAAMPEAPFFS